MPYTSDNQRKAMYAAAEGHSTLGIPEKVGKEFVKAGPSSSLEAMTGLKKTHRGKRSRGKGPKEPEMGETKGHEKAESHMKELSEHMTAGNHDNAKKAAFRLVRALHKQQSLTPQPKKVI